MLMVAHNIIKSNNGALKLTLLLISSLTIMSVLTISPSLPEMSMAFSQVQNSEFLVKLVLTFPALFIAISSPLAGILIDRYGRLKLLWLSLFLYTISGVSGYFLDDLYYILISRAILGVAVGISMTIVITLVADYFEGRERQQFAGTQIAFMSIGGIVFITLAGILADISWRLPFLIYLFALIVLPLTIFFLPEPEKSRNINQQEVKVKSPPVIWLLFGNTMLMWILFFLIPVQVPFHLKALGVESNAMIGAAIAMSTAFSAISAFSYSKIKDRFSFFTIFSAGYLLMALAYALIALIPSYMAVLIAMMLAGLGMGIMIPNTNIFVMKIAPPEIRGKEIGRLTTFWFLGQFLSPILLLPVSLLFSVSGVFYIGATLLFCLSLAFISLQMSSVKILSTQ